MRTRAEVSRPINIALVHNNPRSPWIKIDREVFSKFGSVHEIYQKSLKVNSLSINKLRECDVVVFWFASFNFLFLWTYAKILRKKTIIIAGGYDVSRLPSIKYGAFCEGLFSRLLRIGFFYFTDKTVGVSQSNLEEIKQNLCLRTLPEFCYLGFSADLPPLHNFEERQKRVIMIANIDDQQTYLLKGFDYFCEVAKTLPEYTFLHIGRYSCHDELPSNIQLLGEVEHHSAEFFDALNSSRIIFQHSMIESFCAAVVDGALMGCLPIVSNRFSLPEVVYPLGVVVSYGDVNGIVNVIQKNISTPKHKPHELRTYYAERFSIQSREERLKGIVQNLIHS